MCECHKDAGETVEIVNENKNLTNIKYYREYSIIKNRNIKSQAIKEDMQINIAKEAEDIYILKKL